MNRRITVSAAGAPRADDVAEDESSEYLVDELRRVEAEPKSIGSSAGAIVAFRPDFREWLLRRLSDVRAQLHGECAKAKAVLSASIRDGIRVAPEALGYRLSIAWDLLSETLRWWRGKGCDRATPRQIRLAGGVALSASR